MGLVGTFAVGIKHLEDINIPRNMGYTINLVSVNLFSAIGLLILRDSMPLHYKPDQANLALRYIVDRLMNMRNASIRVEGYQQMLPIRSLYFWKYY